MTNSNISTQNVKESNMDSTNNLIAALEACLKDNPMGYAFFSREVKAIMDEHIKPLCKSSRKSADGNDWRSQLKARFANRGAKWFFVSLEQIEPTLVELEAEGIDTTSYRAHTQKLGKAWIRFKGPKLKQGSHFASFEVRTEGSTIDHPKQLHLISIDLLDELIEAMPDTPNALKLEEDSAPMPSATKPSKPKTQKKTKNESKSKPESSQLDALAQEINIDIEEDTQLSEAPQSDDPAEWQAFLEAEGLVDYDLEDHDDLDDAF